MKRLITLVTAFVVAGTVLFAHGGNEHVRGRIGDRVVIDVPEKTTQALLIQIGAATAAAAHK